MPQAVKKKEVLIDKCIDFGKQIFASVLKSRKGSLSELARLSRFQSGTKGFERQYIRLLPLMELLEIVFFQAIKESMPKEGLRLGIFDDSPIKKFGKKFPKQQIHHDHTTNSFYSGMKVLSTMIYQKGKIFISRIRSDSIIILEKGEEIKLNLLSNSFAHNEYKHIKIKGKSYWIKELFVETKSYGKVRIIVSKEGQYSKPIFIITNAHQFSPKQIVKFYLIRFAIEIFFRDVKQFLNLNTFSCTKVEKWKLHLLLTNVLHWAIQRKKSISRAVNKIRENMDKCLLFINQNPLIQLFFEKFKEYKAWNS